MVLHGEHEGDRKAKRNAGRLEPDGADGALVLLGAATIVAIGVAAGVIATPIALEMTPAAAYCRHVEQAGDTDTETDHTYHSCRHSIFASSDTQRPDEPSQGREQSEDDQMKITDWLLVVVGVLQFVVLGVQAIIFGRQSQILGRQANILDSHGTLMEGQLKATQDAANAAIDNAAAIVPLSVV